MIPASYAFCNIFDSLSSHVETSKGIFHVQYIYIYELASRYIFALKTLGTLDEKLLVSVSGDGLVIASVNLIMVTLGEKCGASIIPREL